MASILVVDDEHEATTTLSKFLETRGYTIDTAANGSEALDRVRETHYELVMTDLRMPGMDGADFLARVRLEQPQLPIVVMTGHTNLGGQDEIWARAGVTTVLQKPLNLREVSGILREMLR
ncbi:MAG: response regulator [Alphaproteobacteria bacterium]